MLHRQFLAVACAVSLVCMVTCGCSSPSSSYERKVELTDPIRGHVALTDKCADQSSRDWDAFESKVQNTGKSAWPYTVADYRRTIYVGCGQENSRTPCGGAWRPVLHVLYKLEHSDHYPDISIPLDGMSHFSVLIYMDTNQVEVNGGA